MKKEGKKYRIGNVAFFVLLFFAVIFDALTLIPGVGNFITIPFFIGAGIYFWKAGLGIVNWRVAMPSLLASIAEFVPGVQELPAILAGVIAVVLLSRIEDRTGMKLMSKGKLTPGVTQPRGGRPPPLNNNGSRPPRLPNGGLASAENPEDKILHVDFSRSSPSEERIDKAA